MARHGIDFTGATSTFADDFGFAGYDAAHSGRTELRWFWFGCSEAGRILTVRYTHRG